MKILYYLFHFLCYMTFILPATCSLVEADRCSRYKGLCRRKCHMDEKQVDVCFAPFKICCVDRPSIDD
ncbi:beta-defensin 114 [Oryctolagus cuniculus]|nr:beta-defensin 114 [Oryctolagus cuniculus]